MNDVNVRYGIHLHPVIYHILNKKVIERSECILAFRCGQLGGELARFGCNMGVRVIYSKNNV